MARPRPSSWTLRRRNATVAVVCVAAAVGGAVADGAPTGLAGFDAVLRAALAVALTLAATQSSRTAWAAAAGVLVVPASRDVTLFVCALALFAVAVVALVVDYRTRVLGAVLGAGIAQVLLRLPSWGPLGTSAAIAGVSVGIVVVSGVLSLRRRTRRRVLIGAAGVGGFVLLLTAGFAVSVLLSLSDLRAGVDAAEAGVDAARRGNTELAISRFDEAGNLLGSAADQLENFYARAARIVPVVGQHQEALRTLALDAAGLAATGALAARDANVDAVRVVAGRLDPAPVAALGEPLARVSSALRVTARDLRAIRSPWLVAPVQSRVEKLAGSVHRATHDARTASLAVRASPRLLGVGQPASFFLMFTQPAEARAGGGLMGNWGLLTVVDGKFDLSEFGRSTELNDAGDPDAKRIVGLDDYQARYGRFDPAHEWRNVNMSPDFPTVAEVVRQLYPLSGGTPVDGVLAIDPTGLAALLKLTGPVRVEGLDEPLTARNAATFLLRDQYLAFPTTSERVDFLEDAAESVTDRFVSSTLPGPRGIGRALGRAAQNGHIRATMFDPDGQRFFERLDVTGEFRRAPGDTFGLVTQNASGNKIELFLQRSVQIDTLVDPTTGRTTSTAVVTLRNDAPASGLPNYVIGNLVDLPTGTTRLYVSLYTTLGVAGAILDGQPLQLSTSTENGLQVHSAFLTIPAGAEAVLQVELEGGNRFARTRDGPEYRLRLWRQTTVNPDAYSVRVRAAEPWRFENVDRDLDDVVVEGSQAAFEGAPERTVELAARIEER